MGRYEDQRPVGFHVDAEGAFKLSNLMRTWVRGRNLTEEIILTELLVNKSRRDGGIRFSVKQEAGDYRIWVHEARRLEREPAQVLSYVAFLMEQGGVELHDGWASLTNIVETMKRKHFIAAVGDADALQELLRKTDYDGRFTIHDGWIRGIDEDDQAVAQNYAAPHPGMVSAPSPALAPRPRPSSRFQLQTPAQASSRSWPPVAAPASSSSPRHQQPTTTSLPEPPCAYIDLVALENQETQGDEEPKGAGISAKAPKNPPGKHWTQYDHGNGFWWYYEGPKGTWWMEDTEHAEPEPYPV